MTHCVRYSGLIIKFSIMVIQMGDGLPCNYYEFIATLNEISLRWQHMANGNVMCSCRIQIKINYISRCLSLRVKKSRF